MEEVVHKAVAQLAPQIRVEDREPAHGPVEQQFARCVYDLAAHFVGGPSAIFIVGGNAMSIQTQSPTRVAL